MSRVAVTGASGFVARHVIPLLLEDGWEVRGLARHRPLDSGTFGSAPGFDFTVGDIRDPDIARSTLEGCRGLIHLAAVTDPAEEAADVTVRGTEVVLTAARAAGVERVIYLSCMGADASAPSPLFRDRWRAEMMVRGSGLSYTVLAPSLILGNGDGLIQPLADLLRTCPIVPVAGRGDSRVQPIDVTDLARCMALCLREDEARNDRVPVGGSCYLTFRQLVDLVAAQVGVPRSKVLVPMSLLPRLRRLLPAEARSVYGPFRRAQFSRGVVSSPGIVARAFGYEPSDILLRLPLYLG